MIEVGSGLVPEGEDSGFLVPGVSEHESGGFLGTRGFLGGHVGAAGLSVLKE